MAEKEDPVVGRSDIDVPDASENVDDSQGHEKGDASSGRRRILKSIGAGGAVATTSLLVDRWHQPVVESVLIPAHAQTTTLQGEQGGGASRFFGGDFIVFEDSGGPSLDFVSEIYTPAVDLVVTRANAVPAPIDCFELLDGCCSVTGQDVAVLVEVDDCGVQRVLTGEGRLGEQIPLGPDDGNIVSATITCSLQDFGANNSNELSYELQVVLSDDEEVRDEDSWPETGSPCIA